MSKGKRKPTFPELERVQSSRRRAQASFAERQGAALGGAAREQLRPLLEASTQAEAPTQKRLPDIFASVDYSHLIQTLRTPSWFSGLWPTVLVDYAPPAPSINSAKLEALKTVAPYRVAPRVPDMVEVITGWRAWMLSGTGRLEALGKDTVWPVKRAIEAECNGGRGRHIAPAWDCTCGVWAFKDVDRLVEAIGSKYGTLCALGTVSLWGRVIETENGYRAQYAYPSELWLLDESLEELGLIYDVPVRMIRG